MASIFPGGADNLATTETDATVSATTHPAHHNDLATAVNAVQAALLAGTATTIAESRVTGLVADLALKAPLAGPSFTSGVTVSGGLTISNNGLAVTGGLQVTNLGITVTGASTITGTLGGITTLTAATFSGALSGNATTATTAGTVTTAAQPTITSTGILAAPHMTSPVVDSGTLAFSTDLFVVRDTANILAQRNGVTAQSTRIYNTYTDASNYERVAINWSSSIAYLTTEAAGTGTKRALLLSGSSIYFRPGALSAGWLMPGGTGHLTAETDNTLDIGTAGANRPRNLYLAGAATIGGNVGFYGTTAAAKQTVSGSKAANAALSSLMTALVALGLVTDTTT